MFTRLKLENVNNGQLLAHINDALDEAIRNLCDPGTDMTQTRTVVVTLKLQPSKTKKKVSLFPKIDLKLQPPTVDGTEISLNVLKAEGHIFMGEQLGLKFNGEGDDPSEKLN